jgi:hypothetical protein
MVPLAGCNLFHSEFPVAVGNRTANTVSVMANGQTVGNVGSNATATFEIEATLNASARSPASPTQVAQVTFSARDVTTGVLSAGVTATVSKDVTTYVDVAPCVPIVGSAPPCVSVSPTTGSSTGSLTPPCTVSLSSSSQSFNTVGGTGRVTVSAPSNCAWSASSTATWVTVVSGASGTGNGTVVFEVAPNPTGQRRTTSLSIGDQTVTISQDA